LFILFCTPLATGAALAPIQLDGFFDDWLAISPIHSDPQGDGALVDFGSIWVANDQDYLYIRFETGGDVQPDEQQQMRLYLDTDMNSGTGTSLGGIGADLVWEFGSRDGNNGSLGHADIGLLMGPTVSSTEFEIALRRDAGFFGGDLASGNSVRFILRDMDAGDLAPNSGSISYTLASGSDLAPTLSTGRNDPANLRFATWNVQSDGLFDGGSAESAQNRMLDVMDPDILVVNEVWNHNANDVRNIIEQHLPSGSGESWFATGNDGGNVLVSRFPILDSWEVNPGYRITAVLLDLGPSASTDLLVVACHWRCCTADTDRQEEADSIIEFLRDARNPGGLLTLPTGTPFILGGDLNLVGWKRQLETILNGDILNEGNFGSDSPPDWDGGPFTPVQSRHPDGRAGYSWRNDYSSYYPGLLDWILYTDSALTLENHYILETRTMKSSTLSANGLYEFDTTTSSDHAPRVADFTLGTYASAVPDAGTTLLGARLLPNTPNPFNPSTRLRFELDKPGTAELTVYDMRGRLVRGFAARTFASGTHSVTWDGRGDDGRPSSSGVYRVRLIVTQGLETVVRTQSVVLVE
jgi:endonuclease/exonuclease/phosphatase family metal-dependent hydrolase